MIDTLFADLAAARIAGTNQEVQSAEAALTAAGAATDTVKTFSNAIDAAMDAALFG